MHHVSEAQVLAASAVVIAFMMNTFREGAMAAFHYRMMHASGTQVFAASAAHIARCVVIPRCKLAMPAVPFRMLRFPGTQILPATSADRALPVNTCGKLTVPAVHDLVLLFPETQILPAAPARLTRHVIVTRRINAMSTGHDRVLHASDAQVLTTPSTLVAQLVVA